MLETEVRTLCGHGPAQGTSVQLGSEGLTVACGWQWGVARFLMVPETPRLMAHEALPSQKTHPK